MSGPSQGNPVNRRLAATVAVLAVLIPGVPLRRAAADTRPTGTIVVTMAGFRNEKGFMRISLFESAKGFPGDHRRAIRSGSGRIQNGAATFTFAGVPHGTYAVAVLHDENGNGKMDTNLVGIPKEGGGASNDAKARFGPPKFDDAKFVIRDPQLKLRINIRYPSAAAAGSAAAPPAAVACPVRASTRLRRQRL